MIRSLDGLRPQVDETAYVDETALLIGDVQLGARASVWPGCVLRGDEGAIRVGEESSIQDLTVIHNTGGVTTTHIGPRVTVGHRVVLHGCRIESDAIIGMGAILLDNATIGPWCIIGAGSLVPMGRTIPTRSLVIGVPGRVVRQLNDAEIEQIKHGHQEYLRLAELHRRNRATDNW